MTYNFDLDRWWEREYLRLEQRRDRGELDDRGFENAVSELEKRLEQLTRNLERSYQVGSLADQGLPGQGDTARQVRNACSGDDLQD